MKLQVLFLLSFLHEDDNDYCVSFGHGETSNHDNDNVFDCDDDVGCGEGVLVFGSCGEIVDHVTRLADPIEYSYGHDAYVLKLLCHWRHCWLFPLLLAMSVVTNKIVSAGLN